MLDTAKLVRAGFLRKYAAGEIICRQGEPGAEMYIILQGEVEIVPGGGKPVIFKSGDFFGEMALLDKLPRSATVRTAAESVLLVLSEDNFKEVIGAEPLLAMRIMKGMSVRLRELDRELRQLKQVTAADGDGGAEVAGDGKAAVSMTVARGTEAVVDAGVTGGPEAIGGAEESGSGGGKSVLSARDGARDGGPDTGKNSSPGAGRYSSPGAENYPGPDIPGGKEDISKVNAFRGTGENVPDVNSGEGLPAATAAAAPVSQGGVLYVKKATCPVCRFTFPVTAFMASKLRTVRQDPELRNHYAGFEPLLYSAWVCPECYYAGPHDSFNQLNARQKAVLKENAPARRQKFGALAPEGSPARAIQGYLLVLENLTQVEADPIQKGRVWLRLAWLYDDAGGEQDARQARQNTLALFKEAYFTSSKPLAPEQEQQMAYLIGELNYRLGDEKGALHFWRRAVMQKGGNAQFTRQVQDRIYDVRGRGGKK